MLKPVILAIALVAGSSLAQADETVIHEGVTVHKPAPDVVIKKREPSATIRKDETVGRGGCDSKTVHKEGVGGSTTVTKKNCD